MKNKLILLCLYCSIIVIILASFTSALLPKEEIVKDIINYTIEDGNQVPLYEDYGKFEVKDWLGLGSTILSADLINYSEDCPPDSTSCSAEITMYSAKNIKNIIPSIKFKTWDKVGSPNRKLIDYPITDYNISVVDINDNKKEKVKYDQNKNYKGDFKVIIEAIKPANLDIDWIISLNDGTNTYELDQWAWWLGNYSNVTTYPALNITTTLNNPINNTNSSSSINNFSASTTITNGTINGSTLYVWNKSSYDMFWNLTGLKAWWDLDTRTTDQSGNGYDLSVNGAYRTSQGKIGGAYVFDGINDYANGTILSGLGTANNFTICLWAYPKSVGSSNSFILNNIPDTNNRLNFVYTTSSKFASNVYNGGSSSAVAGVTGSTVSTLNWYHVCYVKINTIGTIYINGLNDTQADATYSGSATTCFRIGGSCAGTSTQFFNGSIDDVRIYNRSLSSSEVYNLYNTEIIDKNSTGTNAFCYQETANISTSCGGLSTGSYIDGGGWSTNSIKFIIDGNWATSGSETGIGSAILLINYTKPNNSSKNSLWEVKDNGADINLTIIDSCFNNDASKIILRINSTYINFSATKNEWDCWNGTIWYNLRTYTGSHSIYEEAMWWNIPKSFSWNNQNLLDGHKYWNVWADDNTFSYGSWANGANQLNIDTNNPIVNISSPNGFLGLKTIPYNISLNFTKTDNNGISTCWYSIDGGTNVTITSCNNLSISISNNSASHSIYVYTNDTFGNIGYSSSTWSVLVENSITYSNPVVSADYTTIIGNFTIPNSITSATLVYNGTSYIPTISQSGDIYILTTNLNVPNVNTDTTFTFYYNMLIAGDYINSSMNNQTVQAIIISTNCTGLFTYLIMNITNYGEQDSELLTKINGTLDYDFNIKNNGVLITQANGTSNGTNIQICTNHNLSANSGVLNLQLRYYGLGYMYKTYNIQNGLLTSIPFNINLYYLNSSIGTSFIINYVDFYYLTHPGAIIQIQRQYLSDHTYKIVEIPLIADNGASQGAFDANNIRYKLIIIDQGVIIDTFDNVFPVCQNQVLGTCVLTLRGHENVTTTTTGDFTYSLNRTGNTITMTYIIPSGTPRSVTLSTNQFSRFLDNISNCNTTIFASGGTITCTYNDTIGDSLINTQIDISGEPTLYGQIGVSEDLNGFYLLNNYIIAFVLLLSLVLMFISSAMVMLIIGAVGLLFLGLIFLIKGAGLGVVATSLVWIIIAIGLAVYKISQKEERT